MELNWRWLLQEMHIFLSKTKIWKSRAISGANCALERNVSFLILSVSPHRSENFLHKTKLWQVQGKLVHVKKKNNNKNKDQFSIKTSGIEILLNKGTQQDKHLVNCSSPFKYTCYVKLQILTVKFGKSVIFGVKVVQISFTSYKNGLNN